MNLKTPEAEGRAAARAGGKPKDNPYGKGHRRGTGLRGRSGMRRAAWERGRLHVEREAEVVDG